MKVMSKKIRKNIQYSLLLLCILIFWGYGIYYGQFIEENYQSVSIRIHGEGVTSRIIERALENEVMKNAKEIPAVTAWNCLVERQVENAVLSTTAKTRLLEVCGDMKQVYPMELVNGVIPVKGDSNGCLVDKNTAYEIFRTSEVIGNILTYQGKEYYIRGIIDAQERLVILPKIDANYAFSNLELVYVDKEDGEQLAHEFIIQNGLADSYTVLDACFYTGIIGTFFLLPAWILGLYLLIKMIKNLWMRRTIPIQLIIFLIASLVAWEGIRWAMEFKLYLPDKLIPTKWSDFDFWYRKYQEQKIHLQEFAYLIPVPKDILLFRFARRCVLYSLISTAGSIYIIAHRKTLIKNNSLLASSLACILLECVAVLILYRMGRVFTVTRGYMLMLPLFLMLISVRNQ